MTDRAEHYVPILYKYFHSITSTKIFFGNPLRRLLRLATCTYMLLYKTVSKTEMETLLYLPNVRIQYACLTCIDSRTIYIALSLYNLV